MFIFIHAFCNSPVGLRWMKEAWIEFFPLYFSRSTMRRARLGKQTQLGRKVQTAERYWTETCVEVLWTFILQRTEVITAEPPSGLWPAMSIHYINIKKQQDRKTLTCIINAFLIVQIRTHCAAGLDIRIKVCLLHSHFDLERIWYQKKYYELWKYEIINLMTR